VDGHPGDLAARTVPRPPGEEAGDLPARERGQAVLAADGGGARLPARIHAEVVGQRGDDGVAGGPVVRPQRAHLDGGRHRSACAAASAEASTGSISNSARSAHRAVHASNSAGSSVSISWKQPPSPSVTQLSTYSSPSGSIRPRSRARSYTGRAPCVNVSITM